VTVPRGAGVGVTVVVVTVGPAVTVTVVLGPAVPVVLSLADAVLWAAGGVELLDFFAFSEEGAGELAVDDEHVGAGGGPVVWPDAVPASEPVPATWPPPPGLG
jgi:hypothetical protein